VLKTLYSPYSPEEAFSTPMVFVKNDQDAILKLFNKFFGHFIFYGAARPVTITETVS